MKAENWEFLTADLMVALTVHSMVVRTVVKMGLLMAALKAEQRAEQKVEQWANLLAARSVEY